MLLEKSITNTIPLKEFHRFIYYLKRKNQPEGWFLKVNNATTYLTKGFTLIIVSTRSGPVEIISTGTPVISSIRLI